MRFFKVIDVENDTLLKVVKDVDIICMKTTLSGQFIATKKLFSSEDYAVCIDNNIYIIDDKEMHFPEYKKVKLDMISLTEFNELSSLLSYFVIEDVQEPIPLVKFQDEHTLKAQIEIKLNQLKKECSDSIIKGVDVFVIDSINHFDLTLEDQLNLQNIKYLMSQGETQFAYHSKGEPFRYYSKEEMLLIINAANEHILYHNSYFNSLKNYINSLTDIKDVNSIKYGQDFPNKYKSEVLLSFA